MSNLRFSRAGLGTLAAVSMLSGCGGSGTPLSLTPAGPSSAERTHASTYGVLHSFSGRSDGVFPYAGLTNVNSRLYGTTTDGGRRCRRACGTVYRISLSGREKVLYNFKGGPGDGTNPSASLLDVNGTLYGTTVGGGAYGEGTVFAITVSGKETVLYSFKGGTDGLHPEAALVNVNGILYGTTASGGSGSSCGSSGCGTVFSITTSGKETVLYSFKGAPDGAYPAAPLLSVNNILYSTTAAGGSAQGSSCSSSGGRGCGTVFSITTSGKESVRYNFKGGTTDGQNPEAGLINVKGKLYGTSTGAGAHCLSKYSAGCGTVFSVTPSGTETVLHSFGGPDDGLQPQAALLEMRGMLYGTTAYGGSQCYGCGGTVFEISTSGKERVLHSFAGHNYGDGARPFAGLINVKETLYGTTETGGPVYCGYTAYNGCGTVFALTP
jgi:uncharacterized repeat protein (TIGR03803 family)